jgi:hypothetical protein
MSKIYSDQEKDILRQMHAKGFIPYDMAQVLKSRTPEGIRKVLVLMGLKGSGEPEIDMEAFKRIMGEPKQKDTLWKPLAVA